MKTYFVVSKTSVKAKNHIEAARKAAQISFNIAYVFEGSQNLGLPTGTHRIVDLNNINDEKKSKFDEDDLLKLQNQIVNKILKMKPLFKKCGYDYGLADTLQHLADKMSKAPSNNIDASVKYAQKILDYLNNFPWPKKHVHAKKATSSLAKQQFDNAFNYVLPMIRQWADDHMEMMGMAVGDFADHLKLACALAENNKRKINKFSDMDTASRDLIPDRVWDNILTILSN